MMKRVLLLVAAALFVLACGAAEPMDKLTKRVFERARAQSLVIDQRLAPDKVPVTLENGEVKDGKLNGWTSGFYPGSLWYIYEYSGDPAVLEMAKRRTEALDSLLGMKTHHDIGFQVNCSYGNGYRLTSDPAYRDMIVAAANKLAGRFNPVVGCTMSWNPNEKWKFRVIIDNMMNLELLLNAARLSGNDSLKQMACSHANTTLKNHFRPDASSYHVVEYDPETGKVLKRHTHQGFCDESAWSRGQSWGLYGFTMMFRETGDTAYLNHAKRIAAYIIPMLPEDGVPEWDFNAPGTKRAFGMDAKGAPKPSVWKWKEGDKVPRDASAAAVIASGLIELSTYCEGKERELYRSTAVKIMRTLASKEYLAEEGENGGFLLKHGAFNLHKWSGVDAPLNYADYYFLEALLRYKKTYKK